MNNLATKLRTTDSTPIADVLLPVAHHFLGDDAPIAVQTWDGTRAGPADAPLTAVVRSPDALRHIMWAPGELGLARAYVAGELDLEGDLALLLKIGDRQPSPEPRRRPFAGAETAAALVRAARRLGVVGRRPPSPPEEIRLRGRRHSRARDAQAVSHHYDVGNRFFEMLLGPSLTYSCAYWTDPDGGTLEEAQAAKHDLVARKLGLRPGMRLLDVGCGWGSMALHAAQVYGTQVVGITVSREQQRLASERVAAAGLADLVEIRLQDYREISDGPFDAISSIGMFEHVGEQRMEEYLTDLYRLLTPTGRLLNHAISRPSPSANSAVDPRSFMGRYVFPDSALMEVGNVVSAMQRTGFEVRDVQSLREHYARTLHAWSANLEAHWDEAQAEAGPGRARVWRLYLLASAIGFDENRTSIHQVLAARPDSRGFSAMPATRAGMDVATARRA
ncbi:MAG: cyclopropane-fatty-acyl-phospholipid synthase family protein [Actinomycetota bacterium]|nr:cyclopropane-fatty-acyl-phospholipid synthase family protein [Actinomycetota bacterium]